MGHRQIHSRTIWALFTIFFGQPLPATDVFWPYPQASRNLTRSNPPSVENVSLVNPFGEIRDQGALGTCASHGWLAMLENQIYLERGITLDLSERYQIFTNYQTTKNIGSSSTVIAQYPNLVAQFGVMPETLYPYSVLNQNEARFDPDGAQGLSHDPSNQTVEHAIAQTQADEQRATILQQDHFLGRLPDTGAFPIALPLQVKRISQPRLVPMVLDLRNSRQQRTVPCFSQSAETPQLRVTPKEFLQLCFDHQPEEYFTCTSGPNFAASTIRIPGGPSGLRQFCENPATYARQVARAFLERARLSLAILIDELKHGRTVEIGLASPDGGSASHRALWSSNDESNAGHAVIAEGYISRDELRDLAEQKRGMLASGMFDRLAHTFDQNLFQEGKISVDEVFQIPGNQATPEELRSLRLSSRFGKMVLEEGGIILFRNSWGPISIGSNGYQALTYKYLEANSFLILGRRLPINSDDPLALPTYPRDAAPGCPQTVLPVKGDWFQTQQDESRALQKIQPILENHCRARGL